MASKAEYLKKYMSSETGDNGGKKKKIRLKKRANLAILDDNVDWKSTIPKDDRLDGDDPEEAPAVAEVHDEAAPKKWQPLDSLKGGSRHAGDIHDIESRGVSSSPERQQQADLSPPRRDRASRDRHVNRDANLLGGRKSQQHERHASRDKRPRHDSPETSDLYGSAARPSPPQRDCADASPPRRARTPDASPPRRSKRATPDASPPRRKHGTTDASPPRRKHGTPDASPPRRKHGTPDASPPRRKHGTPDASPPRHRRGTLDASPPRRPNQKLHPDKRHPHGRPPSPQVLEESDPLKMASGATAGLQTSEQLRHENTAAREKQETFYRDLAPDVSGKGAETVYRDKEGKRIDPKLERLRKRQEEREKMENDAQFMEWGRG